MRFFCIALSFVLLFPTYVLSLSFSEIMYNPIASEDYNEWIEIYAESAIDLTNVTLCGSKLYSGYINRSDKKTYNNVTMILSEGSYAVITDGGTGTDAYVNYNVLGNAFHVSTSSLCGGLTDLGKTIFLEKEGVLIENITYTNSAKEGNSISKKEAVFLESNPTPGFSNSFILPIVNLSESIQNQSNNFSQSNFSNQSLNISEDALLQNLSENASKNNSSVNNSLANNSLQNNVQSICNWNISFIVNKTFYQSNEEFIFKIRSEKIFGEKTNLTTYVKIYDSNGAIVASYTPYILSETTSQKTSQEYSPNLFGKLKLQAVLETECLDNDSTNNLVEKFIEINSTQKIVTVQNSSNLSTKKENKSTYTLKEITNFSIQESLFEFTKFTDENELGLFIYRGNISSYAVYFLAYCDQKECFQETFHLNHKFTELEVSIPFKEVCAKNYTFLLLGLNQSAETSFIRNISCESFQNTNLAFQQKNNSLKITNEFTANVVAEDVLLKSSNENAKDVAVIFLLVLSIVLNIVLIWKR